MQNTFFPNRQVVTIQVVNTALLATVLTIFWLNKKLGVQLAVFTAIAELAAGMVPARLLGLKPLKQFEPKLLLIARNGKWLGIWTSLWFLLHATLATLTYFGVPIGLGQLLHNDTQREIILGATSLTIFLLLLGLSNKWSYAHIKWWKQINMLVWLVIPFAFVHSFLAAHAFRNALPFLPSWILLALIAVVGISSVFRKKRDYFAFWRVWLMLLGALIATLVVLFYPAIL